MLVPTVVISIDIKIGLRKMFPDGNWTVSIFYFQSFKLGIGSIIIKYASYNFCKFYQYLYPHCYLNLLCFQLLYLSQIVNLIWNGTFSGTVY